VVAGLDWDLWLGNATPRPFTVGGEGYPDHSGYNFYQPFNWRGFYDFGCGALGDMACHILGAPNMALKLGAPSSVECIKKEGVSDFMFPKKSVIRFDFPARGNMPPVKLFWYDGLKANPEVPGVPAGEFIGDLPMPNRAGGRGGAGRGAPGAAGAAGATAAAASARPAAPRPTGFVGSVFDFEAFDAMKQSPTPPRIPSPDGSLFIGDKGMLTTGTYGADTRLIPVEKMRGYHFPAELLTRSPGHHQDWIRACKGGDPSCSNFNVAAPFVEWMLLGVIALRVEGKLEYDPIKMKITNNADANKYLRPAFRKGWQFT
jgi:hypothetical protein